MVLFSKKVAFREGEKCEKMASGEVGIGMTFSEETVRAEGSENRMRIKEEQGNE